MTVVESLKIFHGSSHGLQTTKGRPFEGTRMKLRELFTADVVDLNLTTASKDETVKHLVSLLDLDEKATLNSRRVASSEAHI